MTPVVWVAIYVLQVLHEVVLLLLVVHELLRNQESLLRESEQEWIIEVESDVIWYRHQSFYFPDNLLRV